MQSANHDSRNSAFVFAPGSCEPLIVDLRASPTSPSEHPQLVAILCPDDWQKHQQRDAAGQETQFQGLDAFSRRIKSIECGVANENPAEGRGCPLQPYDDVRQQLLRVMDGHTDTWDLWARV